MRFTRAGYKTVKPLIEVDNEPIIEHVTNIFPGEEDFIFICNSEHLETTNIGDILRNLKPKGKIISISPHKLGPVYAVMQAYEPVIVSYCDYSVYWDYNGFKNKVFNNKCDGCVIAYRGFHPHLLGNDYYAGMKVDKQEYMIEIKEKHSFTRNKMDSFHSAGAYYFRKGAFIRKYFKMLMDRDIKTNDEYYISMVYQLMKDDELSIYVFELEHFLQWGTPEDLEEYVYWSEYFSERSKESLEV